MRTSHRFSRLTAGIALVASSLLAIVTLPSVVSAGPVVTGHPGLGFLWNFDTTNQTDRSCQGFEIQIDGVTTADVLGTYWGTYGQPTVTAATFNGAAGVDVWYQSTYDAATSAWSYATPVGGIEHFGVSLGAAPGDQRYTWLCEDPTQPGHLQQYGGTTVGNGYPSPSNPSTVMTAGVNVPSVPAVATPINVAPGAPVVEQAVQTIGAPAASANVQADAFWVCKWELNTQQQITLGALLVDSALVKQAVSQPMINDMCNLMNPGSTVQVTANLAHGDAGETTVLDVYSYTGPYDDAHTPLCNEITGDPNNCANFLGPLIANDMMAVTVANGGARWGLGVQVVGAGSVSGSDPAGANADPGPLSCSVGRCGEVVNAGTTLTLTETPQGGSTFAGWGGACTGTATTCTVTMSQARNVKATFVTAATVDASTNVVAQGTTSNVTLTGTHFPTALQLKVAGSGLTVKSVTLTDTSVSFSAKASNTATAGTRDVTLTIGQKGKAGYQVLTCSACLTVTARPTVTSVTPASVTRGASVSVTVSGANFQEGLSVALSGTGASVSVTSMTSSTLHLTVSVASSAAKGNRKFVITNPDGGSLTAGVLAIK